MVRQCKVASYEQHLFSRRYSPVAFLALVIATGLFRGSTGFCESIVFQKGREVWVTSPTGNVINRISIPDGMMLGAVRDGRLILAPVGGKGALLEAQAFPAKGASGVMSTLPTQLNEDQREKVLSEIGNRGSHVSAAGNSAALVIWSFDQSKKSWDAEVQTFDFAAGNLRILTHNGLLNYSPTVSPDGKWVAFYALPHKSNPETTVGRPWSEIAKLPGYALQVVSATGGESKPLAQHGYYKYGPGTIAWSPDSTTIYFEHGDSPEGRYPELYSVPLTGGSPKKISRPYKCAQYPAASPDGRHVASMLANPVDENPRLGPRLDGGLGIIDVTSGTSRLLTSEIGTSPKWSPSGRYILFTGINRTGKWPGYHLYVISADGGGKTDLTPPDWPGSLTSRDAFWLE